MRDLEIWVRGRSRS